MHLRIIFTILYFILTISMFCVKAQDNYEVRQINFKGNKNLEKDFLLENMALKEVSYLEKLFTKKEPFLFNQELVNHDMLRLTRVYQSQGFIAVKASLNTLKSNDKKKKIKLQIFVEEGQAVLVDSVIIRFLGNIQKLNTDSLRNKILKKLELKKGERFRDEKITNDLHRIQYAFRNLGYAYVEVDYDLDLKPEEFKTHIFYSVRPGPICYVGETSIEGNKHVPEEFIRKQLVYKQGGLYNKSKLSKTRQNLYHLQLFRVVSVLPQKNKKTKQSSIPVKMYIEEAPRLTTRLGAGYGTEDEFRAFLDLNYRGFLGGARRLNLYAKHSALEPYYLSLRWIQPQLLGTKTTVALNPFISRKTEPGYETRTYGINVPVSYRFNNYLNSTVTYYLENVEQDIEEGDQELKDVEKDKFPYNKSGILTSMVFNNSEPKFSPDRGVNLSLGYKLNGYVFGSDFNYTRLWGDMRFYQKLGEFVLAFRAMAGGIKSTDTSQFIPVEDRFYSGGSNSIRGWNRAKLGPKRESGSPLGGKSILESNFELRYHLFWKLSTVAFIDAGNVWTGSYSYQFGDLAYAAGGGLRLDTPIGPIRFDIGYPVWNEKKSPQFFISVGQAF